MKKNIQVVVVDDHPLYREGVVRTLSESSGIGVAGEGASADDAILLARKHKPDVALLDISMPGDGIEAAKAISEEIPEIKIVMLTVSENDIDVMNALKNGAKGYALKGIGGAELAAIVHTIASGGTYVSPALAANLLVAMQEPISSKRDDDVFAILTKREEEILRLVADGNSNKEAGKALGLQEKTVKHYMTNILQKLQVRNRVEAAVLAKSSWNN